MLKNSDNLNAEMLLLAWARSMPPSAATAAGLHRLAA